MIFIFLNQKLEQIKILEEYESVIWVDRYFEAGEVEIYTAVSMELIGLLRSNPCLYLWSSVSDHLMVIDRYEIETTFEDGSKLLIYGHSIEYLLERRIIWNRVKFKGSLNEGIKRLINENVVNPSDTSRKISEIYYSDTTNSKILAMTTDFDFYGNNLYESIVELCKRHNVGIRMTLDSEDRFKLELYIGEDRSYEQTDNSYVLFSTEFENLGSSNFINSKQDYKNVANILVAYDDNDDPLRTIELNPYESSGIERREIFTEVGASDEPDSYFIDKGRKDLYDHREVVAFEGQIEATKTFVYGQDFNIGDIVQIENEYGMSTRSRVVELVINHDNEVLEIYPTFEAV